MSSIFQVTIKNRIHTVSYQTELWLNVKSVNLIKFSFIHAIPVVAQFTATVASRCFTL